MAYRKRMNEIMENAQAAFDTASAAEAVDVVLRMAAGLGASDAHIDPRGDGVAIRYRIDGELELAGIMPRRLHEEAIARLKILSGARTDIHAIPQDGRFAVELSGEPYNIRVSFMPTYRGENAVVRLLPARAKAQDSFASLGFTPDQVSILDAALSAPNGLILVTGPTGSGKTTTLRVCLGLKAREPLAIMTLEDPVEYEVPGVRHVHIRHAHGVTFASGLRSALRQDPDVIMIGEIRDNETAKVVAHTALTGHLVMSTLHTTSAIEAIVRLSDMGLERYLLASTLRLVVSQRLVRKICGECGGGKSDRNLAPDTCRICRGVGFRGRSVISEILVVGPGLRELIGAGASPVVIEAAAKADGFRPMKEDAEEKVDWGVTTNEEIRAALYS